MWLIALSFFFKSSLQVTKDKATKDKTCAGAIYMFPFCFFFYLKICSIYLNRTIIRLLLLECLVVEQEVFICNMLFASKQPFQVKLTLLFI